MSNLPKISVTVYPNRYAVAQGTQHDLTWPEFLAICAEPDPLPAGGKDALPFWHGAVLRPGGRRCNADVIGVNPLCLDADKLLGKALTELDAWGVLGCAFPSPSGRTDRGRIIIPLKRRVTVAEHYVLWRIVNARLGGMLDAQTIAASQGFYTPAIADPSKWWLREFAGEVLDPDAFDLSDKSLPIRAPTRSELDHFDQTLREREVRDFTRTLRPAKEGERHGVLFKLAQVCRDYALSIERTRQIVLDFNSLCQPPEETANIDRYILAGVDKYRRNAVGCAITTAVQIHSNHALTLKRSARVLAERAEGLYMRGGVLAEFVEDIDGERFVPCTRARINTLLSEYAVFYKFVAEKDKDPAHWERTAVPQWAPAEFEALPVVPHMRRADGIASAPSLRPDGSVLCKPGWDPTTRTIYTGEPVELPPQVSKEQAAEALARLESLFREFPFDSEVSRSVFLSYLLTAVARNYIDGPVPIGLFDATHRQCGKSTLANTIAIVLNGKRGVSDSWDEKRMEERLHTRAVSDGRFQLFDNMRNGSTVESPDLDRALTQMSVSQRRYYTQTPWDVPFRPIVIVTGNGISIGGDLAPRSLYLRLAPDTDKPEALKFDIDDFLGHIERYRLQICFDLLVIWRAWLQAGKPGEVVQWNTVHAWRCVRQALVWLGRLDPALCRHDLIYRDSGAELHERLLAWVGQRTNGVGMSGRQLLESLQPPKRRFGGGGGEVEDTDERAELWALLCHVCNGTPDVRGLGWILRRLRDAPMGGRALRYQKLEGRGGRWTVGRMTAGGEAEKAATP